MSDSDSLLSGLGVVPYFVLGAYLVMLLLLGWISHRRSSTGEEDYYLAGRNQTWIVSSLTIMATFFSSFALLGAPGMVYREGVVFALFSLNVPLAGIAIYLLGVRIWRVGRAKGYVTPADMVADYYDSRVVLPALVSLTGFLYTIPYVMMQIKAGGELSAVLFDHFDHAFEVGAIVLAAITTLYIMIGGMRSVAWTDVIQGLLLMSGMLVGGALMVAKFGGIGGFGEAVGELRHTSEASLRLPGTTGSWPWPKLFTICVLASLGGMVQPAQWMRFYAARSAETLRRSALIFAIVLPPCFLFGIMLVGMGGAVLYPVEHDVMGGVQPAAEVGQFDRILIVFLKDHLPVMLGAFGVLLASLVIVAIMAASMSTADSCLHALSAVVTRDIYGRYLRPKAGPAERVWIGRMVIVAATVIALSFVIAGRSSAPAAARPDAPATAEVKTSEPAEAAVQSPGSPGSAFLFMEMIALLGFVAIAFSAQLLPITLDMLFFRRGTSAGAACGLAVGLAGALVFGDLFGPLAQGVSSQWPVLAGFVDAVEACKLAVPVDASAWGLALNVPVFVLVSLLTRPVAEARRAEYARLTVPAPGGESNSAAQPG